MQYLEGLTDRQTADTVRGRIDWTGLSRWRSEFATQPLKYLLCLELTDVGFDHTVKSEFRTCLITEEAEGLIFERFLSLCQDKGWLKARTRQRTDSTHVLAAIRAVTRLECVGETLRAALNALAVAAPDWLGKNTQPEWLERYCKRIEDYSRRQEAEGRRQEGKP